MKPFDIIKTPTGGIGIITETNHGGTQAHVEFINNLYKGEKTAWWRPEELEIIDSLLRIIGSAMCHPFGSGEKDVNLFFKDRP